MVLRYPVLSILLLCSVMSSAAQPFKKKSKKKKEVSSSGSRRKIRGCSGVYSHTASIRSEKVGKVMFQNVDNIQGKIIFVEVTQTYRRNGIDVALLITACDKLQKLGCQRVTSIMDNESPSVKLFEKCGFHVVQYGDRTHMSKELPKEQADKS